MTITVIGTNKANLMEVIQDPNNYVIKKAAFGKGFRMVPIAEADVCDLTAENTLIVNITNE